MAEYSSVSIPRIWNQLGPREKKVLTRIANRLLAGQKAYGYLRNAKKDWRKEAMEEAMDMSVYLSALLEDQAEDEADPAPITKRGGSEADTDRKD